jgi:DNA-binding transcriptional MerR regulator
MKTRAWSPRSAAARPGCTITAGRKVGFSLREVKQLLDLYDPSGANTAQLRATLDKTAKQQQKLIAQRNAIDEAIEEVQKLMNTVSGLLDSSAKPELRKTAWAS